MNRAEAYANCPPDAYVEYYSGQWLIIPLAPVTQPAFFTCTPRQHKDTP